MNTRALLPSILFLTATLFIPSCGPDDPEEELPPDENGTEIATYVVTYKIGWATGGSAPVDEAEYQEGDTVTVLGRGDLARQGHTFIGWNTAVDGSGLGYSAGDTFIMGDSDVDLYSAWTIRPTYSVGYDGNGAESGSVPTDMNDYEEGQTVTVRGNAGDLAMTGFAFIGWYQEDAPGSTLVAGDSFPMPAADVTLLAQWEATFSITYLSNGGTGTPCAEESHLAGSTVTLSYCRYQRDGHDFRSWNTESDGSGNSYAQGEEFVMPASDLVLHAQWTVRLFEVFYASNGSTSGNTPDTLHDLPYLTVITIADQGDLRKTGHMFIEWNTAEDGTGDTFLPGQSHVMTNHLLLFAKWIPASILTYHGNGSNSGTIPPPVQDEPGATVTLALQTFNKYEHDIIKNFTGWNTAADGSGSDYEAGAYFIMPAEDITLFAQWTAFGARGPGLGTIFIDKGAHSDGWRYMEAHRDDLSASIKWDHRPTPLTVLLTSSGIGYGAANTTRIVNEIGAGTYAAISCFTWLSQSGHSDWFLPSRDELTEMHKLKAAGLGGFADAYYWSSTEFDQINAYGVSFSTFNPGTYSAGHKGNTYRVRAARRF